MPFMNNYENVLSTRQAAELLDVSLRTIQLWVESGALKAWKTPGGHRKISISSVEQLIESRKSVINSSSQKVNPNNRDFSILIVEDD